MMLLHAAALLSAAAPPPAPAAMGPCDVYAKAGSPCVAAHSLTRALYGKYDGPLYSVLNAATKATKDVGCKGPGGVADTAAQDAFCGSALCIVQRIYDQSLWQNHLGIEHGASTLHAPRNEQDRGVNFTAAGSKTTLGGAKVYAAFFTGDDSKSKTYVGQGYSNRSARGTSLGDETQTTYAVISGRHFNDGCCFGKRCPCRCSPTSGSCSLPVSQTTATRRTPHSSLCTPATTRAEPWRPSTWAMRTGRATRAPARRAPGSALISRLECSTAAATKRR